jgi:hypothetical protein
MGAAKKISGMTPAALQNLNLYLEILRKRGLRAAPVSRGTGHDDE